MSRGHGQLQRDLIGALESRDQPVDTFDVAAEVYRPEPNGEGGIILKDAQLVSVRRALAKLAAERGIFRLRRGYNKRAYWADERTGRAHPDWQRNACVTHPRPIFRRGAISATGRPLLDP